MEHTKLPWKTEYRRNIQNMFSQEIFDLSGEVIATLAWYPIRNGDVTSTNREENAEFIVRACNSHYDLLEACEAMDSLMDNLWKAVDWGETFGLNIKLLNEAPIKLRAAIKAARGEK